MNTSASGLPAVRTAPRRSRGASVIFLASCFTFTATLGSGAAFALLASMALHDKQAKDAPFVSGLRLIERAASDDRNFVKKGVNWALRSIGRRNAALHAAAVAVARRLSESGDAALRWVGKDALRELTSAAVTRRLAAKG